MADIINLRRARKRKERAEKDAKAAENRIAFGRSKAERALGDAQKDLATRRLDSHKRDGEAERRLDGPERDDEITPRLDGPERDDEAE